MKRRTNPRRQPRRPIPPTATTSGNLEWHEQEHRKKFPAKRQTNSAAKILTGQFNRTHGKSMRASRVRG